MNKIVNAQRFTHNDNVFYLCLLTANILTQISYVSRRGIDEEQGAIQRVLNKKRIGGIRDFLLNGGFFPNNIILNVKSDGNLLFDEKNNEISFLASPRIAQIIDGQHRVEGLKEAVKNDPSIKNILLPCVLAHNLTTERCAEIFISINTEQKAVPKSLIYDLYGLMNISSKDFSIERGADIANILNTDDNSPYQGYIKFPGSRKFKGGIQVSTFVNSIKPLVKNDGEFSKYSLKTLDYQASALKNYFNAIQSYYGKDWGSLSNPFIFAAGFSAAIELFITKILPYCFSKKNFTENFFKDIIVIPKDKLIKQSEVRGMSGENSRNTLRKKLSHFVSIESATEDDFEI